MENYYKILGLKLGATLDEVEKKHSELLKEFDPNLRNARGKFDIVFYVTSENLSDPIIPKMLKAYMDEFHK